MVKRRTQQSREEIFAIEEFRAGIQHVIWNVMKHKGVSQKKLAELLDCSSANISQMLSEDGNPTTETIARIFFHLGDKPIISSDAYQAILKADVEAVSWVEAQLPESPGEGLGWQWDRQEEKVVTKRSRKDSVSILIAALKTHYDDEYDFIGNDCGLDKAA